MNIRTYWLLVFFISATAAFIFPNKNINASTGQNTCSEWVVVCTDDPPGPGAGTVNATECTIRMPTGACPYLGLINDQNLSCSEAQSMLTDYAYISPSNGEDVIAICTGVHELAHAGDLCPAGSEKPRSCATEINAFAADSACLEYFFDLNCDNGGVFPQYDCNRISQTLYVAQLGGAYNSCVCNTNPMTQTACDTCKAECTNSGGPQARCNELNNLYRRVGK